MFPPSEKEYWRRSRSAFASTLRPKAVCEYVDGMNQVCVDLVDRITYLKDMEGGTHLVPRLLNELNKFTMESEYKFVCPPPNSCVCGVCVWGVCVGVGVCVIK